MISHLGISRARLAFILGALAMLGPFSIDTIFPAFAVMQADLHVDKVAMQQTISMYLLGYAGMSLFHGPLSDALGRRPVILAGIVVFTLASVGCALATSMPQILFLRVVQGLSAGVGLIVGRAVVRDALDGDDAQRLMSHISMIFGVAPAIAPIIGGWILGWSNWQAIFWFLSAFGLLMLTATAFALPESHPPERRLPLDVRALAGAYKHIVGNRRFRLLAFAGTANFGALFLYITSAPAFVLDLLKLNEQQFGYFFAPTIGGMILGAFFSGRAAGRMTGVRLANIGFAFCGLSAAYNISYTLLFPTMSLPWAVLPTVLSAFGIALVFPILTIAILDMYPNQRGSASSMQAFVGLLSNALIAGVLSPLLSDSGLHLALGSAVFSAVAYGMWRWYLAHTDKFPEPSATPEILEPTDEM
ncbi:MAG TPA: multidrug effflux MFS transporter [Arenimonas sp.]|uniref:multidrug effflux MFS transporter n=1 Tax=Arenimonas sp. TaxID=1872635 RepID=UPI002B7C21C4|nr:multidrug effflux MFS transporter [Arenimonas sp.]HMB57277.1 multidrug effflux MFS transporter [Arenimonas sp.]